ncbi:hypothetical protein ACFFS2_04495 [Streptomyces aurantiacus]|uniref:Secreted protein n=1 Tax=Streptomyces aurantiacus TaxID=47760 RepID=A0A7G1NYZ1_9ACTN|nr:hypothetical protein [Streptomyces aurantiacus]BCL28673.1 hypothetical protein GCM10017557_35320 [Streptomyces aurantiacus]
MRKLSSLATMATLAGLVVIGPVPSASAAAAAATCRDNYDGATAGWMYAYDKANCEGYLGGAQLDDNNWGNSLGGFQGSDDNKATSIINKGEYSQVKFYNYTRPHGDDLNPHICLTRAEGFASNLSDDYWEGLKLFGTVNNSISAHQWVDTTSCSALAE